MLEIKMICSQCGVMTIITPAITEKHEDLSCEKCNAFLLSLFRTKN